MEKNSIISVLVDPNNMAFILVMICLAIWEIVKVRKGSESHLEGIIVGLGILGTFWGIFIGLQDFNSKDIEGSIPPLLDGLKTAFITSIAGMGISLLLTLYKKIFHTKILSDNIDLSQAQLQALREILASQKAFGDLSIVENKKHADRIEKCLSDSLSKIGDGASKEIIKSLEGVIKDFNSNLTQQFGDNFKELNAAVQKLLEWQGNYKSSIEVVEKRLIDASSSLETAKNAYEAISLKSSSILDVFEKHSHRINELNTVAESISILVKGMEPSFKTMSSDLNGIATSIEQSVQKQQVLSANIADSLGRSLGTLDATLARMTSSFAKDYEEFLKVMLSKVKTG